MAKTKKRFNKQQAHMMKKEHRKQRRNAREQYQQRQEAAIEKARLEGAQVSYRVTRATLDKIFKREVKSPSGLRYPSDREQRQLTLFPEGHPCKPIETRYHNWNGGCSEHMQKAMRDLFYMLAGKYKSLFTENVYDRNSFVNGCIRLCEVHDFWVRSPKNWKPKHRNPVKRFHSLMNHLLCKYPVPEFMVTVMVPGDLDTRYWVTQIGCGEKPKDVLGEKLDVTKRVAHLWMQTSSKDTWVQGLRKAQAQAVGCTPDQVKEFAAVRQFNRIENRERETFRSTQIQWFANNPMLATDQIGPMLDYISHLKTGWNEAEQGPFEMAGRGANRLFTDMQAWHAARPRPRVNRQGRTIGYTYYQGPFDKSGIREVEFEVGAKKTKWKVVEILSSKDLATEGQALHHCVASYSNAIHNGRCHIWSLRKQGKPVVTIEVDSRGTVVQCRGACNRKPEKAEMQLIVQWAQKNNLMIGRYV